MRRLVLIIAATEIVLLVATRLIVSYWSASEWQPELLRSAFRMAAVWVFWHFCRTIIFSGIAKPQEIAHPLSIAAICLFLSVPLLVGNWLSMAPLAKTVFAATSIVVAIHEEFLFRGIVQNLFMKRWGILGAIGLTSALATIWHWGALPLNVFNFLQVFTASCILGLIYVRTRSMMLVVSLHGLYDAIWSLTPVLREPLAWHWGAGVLLLALFVTWLWARREPWPNLRLDADAEPVARP